MKTIIDVRSKEALAAFDGCQYLQVEIFENQVVVSGYDAHKSTLASKVKRSVTKVVSRSAKVLGISDFLSVQKRAELVLSKKDLARASGDFTQLPLFSLDELDSGSTSVRSVKAALSQLHIALQVDSLFSGAGFLDLGFQHNGFTIAFAVEKDSNAGGNVHDIPEDIRPRGTHSDMYKRVFWDEPSITIVNPRKAMLLHPEENRILSVRECARLQGVDDSFVFQGDLSSKQQQVANGVPVHLGAALARVVKNAILMFNIRHRRYGLAW